MATNSTHKQRPGINILEATNDEREKIMFQHVLETKFDAVKNELACKNIHLYKLEKTDSIEFFTRTDNAEQDTNYVDDVVRILFGFTRDLDATLIQRPFNCQKHYMDDLKFHETKNGVWVSGNKKQLDHFCRKYRIFNKSEIEEPVRQEDNIDTTWDNVSLKEIILSQGDQARVYLYRMWDIQYFKKNGICFEREEQRYTAKVKFLPTFSCTRNEKDIISDIQERGAQLVHSEFEFKDHEIAFLERIPVYQIVDNVLNYPGYNINCVWYINAEKKCVTIFAKDDFYLKRSCTDFEKTYFQGSIGLPRTFLESQKVLQIAQEFESSIPVSVRINSNTPAVDYICLADKKTEAEQTVRERFMVTSERVANQNDVQVHTFCRLYKNEIRESVLKRCDVHIIEEEKSMKYFWVLNGLPTDVEKAKKELEEIVSRFSRQEKRYQVDGCLELHEKSITQCTAGLPCLVTVEKAISSSGVVNLQKNVLCHEWQIPFSYGVRLVNDDSAKWISSTSHLLKLELTEKQELLNRAFYLKNSVATVYIPPWNDDVNQERRSLSTCFGKFCRDCSWIKAGTSPIDFGLEEVTKTGWQKEKFMNAILSVLNDHKSTAQIHIYEESRKAFEVISSTVRGFVEQLCRSSEIKVQVITGELAKQKVDAIVNSTNENLKLNFGALSASILKAAGEKIQHECDGIMKDRRFSRLESKEVVVTGAGAMQCKHVFHGALVSWEKQTLAEFVENCLQEADLREISSLAFPSLGTGKLNYPPKKVAQIMFETVQKYGLQRKRQFLKEVRIVIFEKDHTSLKAFSSLVKVYKTGCLKKDLNLKCHNHTIIQVTMTGFDNESVETAFKQVEDALTQRNKLVEPPTQTISRTDKSEPSNNFGKGGEANTQLKLNNASKGDGKVKHKQTEEENINEEFKNHFVKLCINNDTDDVYIKLKRAVKKYNISDEQLVWSPLTPGEARIQVTSAKVEKGVTEMVRNESNYKIADLDIDSVVNIRAKVSNRVRDFLIRDSTKIIDLKKQTGIGVTFEVNDVIMLIGDLYSISAARHTLSGWLENQEDMYTKGTNEKLTNQIQPSSTRSTSSTNKTTINHNNDHGTKSLVFDERFPFPQSNQNVQSDESDYPPLPPSDSEEDDDCCQPEGSGYDLPKFPSVKDTFMIYTKEGMKVYIYQGNLCYLNADCIVNSSNENMNAESGLCSVVIAEGGQEVTDDFLKYLAKEKQLKEGNICNTTAGNLQHYKCILHACVPVWDKRSSRNSFIKSLEELVKKAVVLADDRKLQSIAFPAMGTGGRGGPKQVCFLAYAEAVKEYSSKFSKTSFVKAIHFVDRDIDTINMLQAAFVHIIVQTEEKTSFLKKISPKMRNTYAVYVEMDKKMNRSITVNMQNNVNLVISDGPLFSSTTIKHGETTLESNESGIVITINKKLDGKSRSALLCFLRCGDKFDRGYDALNNKKKTICDVYCIQNDYLKFGQTLCALMPPLNIKARKKDSNAQKTFFFYFDRCCRNIFQKAVDLRIKHLVLPIIAEDFYDYKEDWFVRRCTKEMFNTFYECSSRYSRSIPLTLHFATDKNDQLFQICESVLKESSWILNKEQRDGVQMIHRESKV